MAGIARVPGMLHLYLTVKIEGASVETLCLLMGDLCRQPIDDAHSDAGRLFPAVIVVVASLINRAEVSPLNTEAQVR